MENLPDNKLDKQARTQVWAAVLPLMMAANCLFLRGYLWFVSSARCGSGGEGFSFDLYSSPSSSFFYFFFFDDLPCSADGFHQFFYKCSGVLLYISLGLAAMLPFILHLRSRPAEEMKLFE